MTTGTTGIGAAGADEVFAVPARLQAAWAAGDADALAAVFTDNGSMLVADSQLHGPAEIRDHHRAAFAGELAGTVRDDEPVALRIIAPGVAFAVTRGGVRRADTGTTGAADLECSSWVVAKQGDEWKLVSHQTSPVNA